MAGDRRLRAALSAFRPPEPFPVSVWYWERGRGPETVYARPAHTLN